jgi:hypothetical protein
MVMKDADWRGLVLKALYDVRHDQQSDGALMIPDSLKLPGIEMDEETKVLVVNIAEQLKQYNYITWIGFHGPYKTGRGKITAFGVEVIEGTRKPEITLTIDPEYKYSWLPARTGWQGQHSKRGRYT